MKTTIEISNYPLSEDYEPKILDFIERCQAGGVKTKVNTTSTHIQGDYDVVMISTALDHLTRLCSISNEDSRLKLRISVEAIE